MAVAIKAETNGRGDEPRRFVPQGHVDVDPLRVLIEASFDHPDIVSYAQNDGLGLDPLGTIQALLVTGIAASQSVGAYALAEEARQATDALRALLGIEAEAMIRDILKRALSADGEDGVLIPDLQRIINTGVKGVEAETVKLTRELKGAGEDALPQLIEKRVRRASREVVQSMLSAAFAEDGPLGVQLANNWKLLKELRDGLSHLQQLYVEAKTAADHVDPAAAGREWEPSTLDEIARLSLITGDRVEQTGDTPGHGRMKKGDGVLHLASPKGDSTLKVVVECRTGKERMTLNDLRKAKENREAEAALLVAERPQLLPKDAEGLGFRAYWDERVVVLHYDPAQPGSGVMLAAGLQIVRMFAQLAAVASVEEIDHDRLRQSISRIEKAIAKVRPIRASLTGIDTEISRIRGYAQEIEDELRGALGELTVLAA
jgi:hypothetical protein